MGIDDLDLNGSYTYADYLKWTFEERLELIKGKIFRMSPSPTWYHQSVGGNIYHAFKNEFQKNPCKVCIAPFDVRLTKKGGVKDTEIETVVQPDICVVCDATKLDIRGCLGAPDLIVEVLSPATAKRDVQDKYRLYEENGVKEYWVVHPKDAIVTQYVLDESGHYRMHETYTRKDMITPNLFPQLSIALEEVFEDVPE